MKASTRLARIPRSNPAAEPKASSLKARPNAACITCLRCAPMATRMPNSRRRLLTEYAAIPKMPVMESIAPIAPSTPSATVATWGRKQSAADFVQPRFNDNRQPCIQLVQRTPYRRPQLLRIAAGAHNQPCGVGWPLQNGEKHRRLGFFGKFQVLAVLCDTHHLYARSIRHFVVTADCVFHRAKDFERKFLIHYSNARRILVVMPCESPAGQQRSALGMKVFGRYVVSVDVSGGTRWPQVGGFIAKDSPSILFI